MTMLSKNISEHEFTRSDTASRKGIRNEMTPAHRENAKALCAQLQKIRDFYNAPIDISSGYRGPALNRAVGGSKNSQHMVGEAGDFTVRGVSNARVIRDIVGGKIPGLQYDQLIDEASKSAAWIHMSHRIKGNRPKSDPSKHLIARPNAWGRMVYKRMPV